jgi:hypothetical protein
MKAGLANTKPDSGSRVTNRISKQEIHEATALIKAAIAEKQKQCLGKMPKPKL